MIEVRFARVSHSAVQLATTPAADPATIPVIMSVGPCITVHAIPPWAEPMAKDLKMV